MIRKLSAVIFIAVAITFVECQERNEPVDDLAVSDSVPNHQQQQQQRSTINEVDDLEVSAQAPAPTLVRIRPNTGRLTTFIAPAIYRPQLIPIPLASSGVKGVASPSRKQKPISQSPVSQQPVQIFESQPVSPHYTSGPIFHSILFNNNIMHVLG